ncbi:MULTISPECIES: hypothetical protein [Streptomyces]|uniref:Uncharacterized protein n=1 Tax=Streptomyces chilikensis TaxID=1194079 RepID=A0ABV3ES78_9ACTN|nr:MULTISPECIES: hypothetical protein [Streptomyces]MDH6223911.1 hypothetical protein [Streptomyces sp. MJP52]
MSEKVPVRCPACRREHVYRVPAFPCACGTPVAPALDVSGEPAQLTRRVWQESWVTVPCPRCCLRTQWPWPELGCPCGVVLRLPVLSAEGATGPSAGRPAFQPVTIRTPLDAVTAAALYLRWLGYPDVRRADQRPPSGIGLAARGLVAHVDPGTGPSSTREVECLWLTAMTESARGVHFSLAGYDRPALERAGQLEIPLFLLDRTGTPQAVNDAADALAEG